MSDVSVQYSLGPISNAPPASLAGSPYEFKQGDPYSSHSVILSLLPSAGKGKVLDVGAAHGYIAAALRQRGFTVTGIEGDPLLASEAIKHCDRLFVLDLDGPLSEIEGDFDYILYGDVLEHLKDPLEVLMKLNAKLRPNGLVIISLPNVANIYVRLQLLMGRFDYSDRGILDRTHLRFFTRKSFRSFLDAGGLALISLKATPIPLPMVVPQRFHGRFLSWIHSINAWLAQRWQTVFGYQFVALARPGNFHET
jgi:SAM-dependent methyltransferase